MASFTISSSQTWAAFRAGAGAAFAHNDDLVINPSVTFTFDNIVDRIIGQVTSNGHTVVDGTVNDVAVIGSRAEEINVNGLGSFTVNGKWKSIGTTNGTASQVIAKPAAGSHIGYHSHISGLWIETGRRILFDNENTAPDAGQDAYTPQVDDYVCLQSNPNKPFGQIKAAGANYIVVDHIHVGAVVDNDQICIVKDTKNWGLDRGFSQVWTADVDGTHAKEVGVYSRWHNANGFSRTVLDYGTGWGCNCFQQEFGTDITLPDGTNGNLPPSGCDIRIPNVYFGTSDAAFTVEADEDSWYSRYNLETANGGVVNINYANLGGVMFSDYSASAWDMSHCLVQLSFGGSNCGSDSVYTDIIAAHSKGNNQNGSVYAIDTPNKTRYVDCTFAYQQDATYPVDFEPCSWVDFYNCEWIGHNTASNGGFFLITNRSPKVTAKNILLATGASTINTATDVHLETVLLRSCVNGTLTTMDNQLQVSGCSNVYLSNFYDVSEDDVCDASYIKIVDCADVRVRNAGMIDYPISLKDNVLPPVFVDGLSRDIEVARVYFVNSGETRLTNMTVPQANLITFRDCQLDDVAGANIENSNSVWDNVMLSMEQSDFSTSTSNVLLTLNSGSGGCHQLYGRYSTSKGVIYHLGQHVTAASVSQVSATNITFEKNGRCSGVSGSELIIYGQHKIRGVTGFDGEWQECDGSDHGERGERDFSNISCEYRIDGGAWTAVSFANLTAEVLPVAGFLLDMRFTWSGAENFICFGLYYDTSTTAQKENLLPIDQESYALTLNGLQAGSDVVILAAGTQTVLAAADQILGTSYVFEYQAVQAVDIGIIKQGYVTQYIYGYNLQAVDAAIPIQQLVDRNYI